MVDHGIKPCYIFDGKPPELKGGVVSPPPLGQTAPAPPLCLATLRHCDTATFARRDTELNPNSSLRGSREEKKPKREKQKLKKLVSHLLFTLDLSDE